MVLERSAPFGDNPMDKYTIQQQLSQNQEGLTPEALLPGLRAGSQHPR